MSDETMLDKHARVHDKMVAIREFLAWREELDRERCDECDSMFEAPLELDLAEFFGIDLAQLERERRELLRQTGERTRESKGA